MRDWWEGGLPMRTPRDWVAPFMRFRMIDLWQSTPPSQLPPTLLHYFRSPKTGSSALLERLTAYHSGARRRPRRITDVHEFELPCSSTNTSRLHIHIHDHGSGCANNVCNASALVAGASAFTVLREPCERFQSVLNELTSRGDAKVTAQEMGSAFDTLSSLVDFVEQLLGSCAGRDSDCAVQAINRRVKGPSRIFLYPQALFVAIQRPAESLVCFDRDGLGLKLDRFLARQTGCTVGAAPRRDGRASTSQEGDASSWNFFTGMRQRNRRHNKSWHGYMSSRHRDPHPKPKGKAAGPTLWNNSLAIQPRTLSTCERIRRVYSQDAEMWMRHCAEGARGTRRT